MHYLLSFSRFLSMKLNPSRKMKLRNLIILLMTALTTSAQFHSDQLISVVNLGEYKAIGVGVSSDNRLFVGFPRMGGKYEFGLTEIVNGKKIPYPNLEWNQGEKFANVQDLFVDANDFLWVLDSKPSSGGSIFGDKGEVADGQFQLLKINLKTDQVDRIYRFEDVNKKKSGLNDIRIDTDKNLGYLSDPAQSSIIILDLETGKTRKVLEKNPFTLAKPDIVLKYEGNEMRDDKGNPFKSNINGIALTKDFKYFYFKPINHEHLFRIETQYLADAALSETELEQKVEDMGKVGVTHGLEADAKGNIFLSTSLDYTVKYLSPDGKLHTLVKDIRLLWPDSFGVGTDGYLYFSCAQLQLDARWNKGVAKNKIPYEIYKVKLP
jgi:sugar lactone lactonase YvrE